MSQSIFHPLTEKIVEAWNKPDIDIEQLKIFFDRRWKGKGQNRFPKELPKINEKLNLNKSLQIYLLAESRSEEFGEVRNSNAILEVFSELSMSKNYFRHGTLWFEDCLSLRRYSGDQYHLAMELFKLAFRNLSTSDKPAINPITLNKFARVYNIAAMSLIGEVISEELTDRLFVTEQVDFPFSSYNFFRDIPIVKEFSRDEREEFLKYLNRLASETFLKLSKLYVDEMSCFDSRKAKQLGIYRQLFDRPALLLSASSSEFIGQEKFLLSLIKYLQRKNVTFRIGNWQPGEQDLVWFLEQYWDDNAPKPELRSEENVAQALELEDLLNDLKLDPSQLNTLEGSISIG